MSSTTLRDYFAAEAMKSLIATPMKDWPVDNTNSVSEAAYIVADAMLEARK
jgi:hypothetical protein